MPIDDRELLWGLYQDVVTQGRHHEEQRLGMTNVVLIVGAAVLGLVAIDDKISSADLPAGIFLIALGIMGAFFSLKQYERFRWHMAFAKEYRDALHIGGLDSLRTDARKAHEGSWSKGWRGRVRTSHLHWWWAALHVVAAALGIVVVVMGLA